MKITEMDQIAKKLREIGILAHSILEDYHAQPFQERMSNTDISHIGEMSHHARRIARNLESKKKIVAVMCANCDHTQIFDQDKIPEVIECPCGSRLFTKGSPLSQTKEKISGLAEFDPYLYTEDEIVFTDDEITEHEQAVQEALDEFEMNDDGEPNLR